MTQAIAPKKPSKLTGHELYIENMRVDSVEVKLSLLNNTSVTGKVRAADKYTISVLTADGETEVVFKHAIAKFSPTKRGSKK